MTYDYTKLKDFMQDRSTTNKLLVTIIQQNEKLIELLTKPTSGDIKLEKHEDLYTCNICGKTESNGKPFDNKQKLSAHQRFCKGVG